MVRNSDRLTSRYLMGYIYRPDSNKMKTLIQTFLLCAVVTLGQAQTPKALISLTYDDGMETHIQHAIPQLNTYQLKGTFYINSIKGNKEAQAWQEAATMGHELGNHSLHHACPESMGWKKPFCTDYYTLENMLDEIGATSAILKTLDPKAPFRTYAYPCNNFKVGGQSYINKLVESKLIKYARGGGTINSIHTSAKDLDPFHVPSWPVQEGCSLDTLISFLESVYQKKGFGVLQFHGIGGQWIKISNETHIGLLFYLEQHKDRFEVLPFGQAMKKFRNE